VNCREVLAKLYDYLDSELPSDEKHQVKSHLEVCTHCLEQYELEEDFNKLIQQKVKSPADIQNLKSKVLQEIEKIDRGDNKVASSSSSGRSVFYLLAPIAAAALIALVLINPFSPKGSVLEAVYPFAMEHNKCLDHVLQYLVKSQDPQVVQSALAHFGSLPDDLFKIPQSDYQIEGAALAHTDSGEKPHIDYDYSGTDVSIFVLDRDTIDKSAFRQLQHNGKTYYMGSCPKFHYVIWQCKNHECIAVSKLGEDQLLGFASTF